MATLSATEQLNESPRAPGEIEVPAPTAWPFILALGAALLFAGLVTSMSVSCLGALLAMAGCVGWFREVFPREHEEVVPVVSEDIRLTTDRRVVERLPVLPDQLRAWLPVHTYPISAGVKGGLAGSVAMAVLACAYGILKVGSIWYPINLLAAGGFISWAGESDAFLAQFHMQGLVAGLGIHAFTSLLVGSLYGAMLPMFPKRPILTCGFVAPFLWTGLLYSSLGILSPILDQRIHWGWFFLSQVAFGLVAGYVVNLSVKVRSEQFRALPFAVRAGLETDRALMMEEEDGKKDETK